MDQVSVCNLALARLGAQSAISSLPEGSPEAPYCGQFWDQARDATLAANDWTFAKVSAALALVGTAPATWQYQYAVPRDCLRARHIQNPLAVQNVQMLATGFGGQMLPGYGPPPPVPFERGLGTDSLGNQGAVIWTNQAGATLVYTARVLDPNLWEPGFVSAFSWQMAMELALPVTGNGQLQDAMARGFQAAIDAAKNAAANERVRIDDHVPDWISVRGLAADELSWALLTQQSVLPSPPGGPPGVINGGTF